MNELVSDLGRSASKDRTSAKAIERLREFPFALRVQIQICILFLLAIAWCGLIQLDSVADYRVRSFISTIAKSSASTQNSSSLPVWKDPVIGTTPLGNIKASVLSSEKEASIKGFVVVYVGDCAGCTKIDLNLYNSMCVKDNLRLVLLTTGSSEDVKHFVERLKFKPSVIVDDSGFATKSLNTIWTPRTYLLSHDGKLVWIQKSDAYLYDPFKDVDFKKAVKEVKNEQ